MIAAALLALALGDCIDAPKLAPAHKPAKVTTYRKHSLLKPKKAVVVDCDEGPPPSIVEVLFPAEQQAEYTPAPEMVPVWPTEEVVTPMPLPECECFGQWIGGGSGGGGFSGGGGLVLVPITVAPIPEPPPWLCLLALIPALSYWRLKR